MARSRRIIPGIPPQVLQTRMNASNADAQRIAAQNQRAEIAGAMRQRAATQRRIRRTPNNANDIRRSINPDLRQAQRQQTLAVARANANRLRKRIRNPRTPRFGGRPGVRRI